MKHGDDQWVTLTEFATENERVEIPTMEIDGKKIRPMLSANLYDKEGNPVMMVFTVPMDHMPPNAAAELHAILQGMNMTPALLLPEQVKCLRTRPISAAKARQLMDLQRRNPPKPPQPQKRPERPRIIVPNMAIPKGPIKL